MYLMQFCAQILIAQIVWCLLIQSCKFTKYFCFRWTFNNSAEAKDVEERFIRTNGSKSILTFTPTRTLEYGTLMCWSENIVGVQKDPCIFHIIAAGKSNNESIFKLQNYTNDVIWYSILHEINIAILSNLVLI